MVFASMHSFSFRKKTALIRLVTFIRRQRIFKNTSRTSARIIGSMLVMISLPYRNNILTTSTFFFLVH